MQYLYSALTIHKSGNEVTEDAVTKVLKAAGADVDKSRVKALVAALTEVDIDEALATAVAAPMAAAPVAAAGGSDTGSSAAAADDDDDDDEEEGEVVEDDDDDGLGSLFG